ncbi:MAG TPA: hypothetical protein VHE77_14305, partial [Dongiaceae bacterium]|nr:hypothetical protein [Dongiaceae bacterium]
NSQAGGGGGGGVGHTTGINSSSAMGSGINAGNNGDADYALNAGKGAAAPAGGADGGNGNDGRVVLIW